MHLHFHIFLLVYILLVWSSCSSAEQKAKDNEARLAEFLNKISDAEFNQALSRLTFNDLFTLNSFMDASKNIVAEDDYENENYQDEHKEGGLHNYHLEDTESDLNDKQNSALNENNVRYKRALLAAKWSWANKRRARNAAAQLKNDAKQQQEQPQQQEEVQQQDQTKAAILRRKRENRDAKDKLLHEQYLQDLENSFSCNLAQQGDDALINVNEHVRIKRK